MPLYRAVDPTKEPPTENRPYHTITIVPRLHEFSPRYKLLGVLEHKDGKWLQPSDEPEQEGTEVDAPSYYLVPNKVRSGSKKTKQ